MVYKPLYNENKQLVGLLYVGIPQEINTGSLHVNSSALELSKLAESLNEMVSRVNSRMIMALAFPMV